MTETGFPDGLERRHADRGPAHASLLSLVLLGGILVAAMLGAFGGGPAAGRTAETPDARLTVHMPTVLRSGLFFEMRVQVAAHRDLADATIAIPPSLWQDMTINTVLPQADPEAFESGAFRFHYGPLAAGEQLEVKIDGQINPPLFAGTRGEIALLDGDARIAAVPISIRVLP